MRHFILLLCLALLGACATHSAAPTAAVTDSLQWEADIAAFEQADSLVRRMPGGVVFVGSSSIRLSMLVTDGRAATRRSRSVRLNGMVTLPVSVTRPLSTPMCTLSKIVKCGYCSTSR